MDENTRQAGGGAQLDEFRADLAGEVDRFIEARLDGAAGGAGRGTQLTAQPQQLGDEDTLLRKRAQRVLDAAQSVADPPGAQLCLGQPTEKLSGRRTHAKRGVG